MSGFVKKSDLILHFESSLKIFFIGEFPFLLHGKFSCGSDEILLLLPV